MAAPQQQQQQQQQQTARPAATHGGSGGGGYASSAQAQDYRYQQAQAAAMQHQMQQQQQHLQYVAADGTISVMPAAAAAAAAAAGQPPYYVQQQPIYLDQNGQPMYYRVGRFFLLHLNLPTIFIQLKKIKNNNVHTFLCHVCPQAPQYQQEMVYPTNPDGIPGDPHIYMPSPYNHQSGGSRFWPAGQDGSHMYPPPTGQRADGGSSHGRNYPSSQHAAQSNRGAAAGRGVRGEDGPSRAQEIGQRRGGSMSSGRDDRDDHRGERHNYRDHGDREGRGGGGHFDRKGGRDHQRNGGGNREHYNRGGDRGEMGGMGGGGGNSNLGANPSRDPVVDEFRSTFGKSRQWSLRDIAGHVVAFCQDQHGSRFVQQRIEVCSDLEKQMVFDEVLPVAGPLMTDVFGNYVLQKMFEYGTPDQCESLAALLTGQAVHLAMQMYGCRVAQKALEYVETQRLLALVAEFESPSVLLRCVHDSNGNHVIQKCIEVVRRIAKETTNKELSDFIANRIQFIIDTFSGRVKELSSHPYGCRVVQRILEYCPNPQKTVILEELRLCCADLVQDCYGNYVIQFVMQHGWEADRAVLIHVVQANLLDFSQHKFASNVVEKCLQYASRRDRDEMIWTIINVTFDMNNPVDAKGHCVLESMVRDPYANYVVQKLIDVSDERQRAAILRYVRENIIQV